MHAAKVREYRERAAQAYIAAGLLRRLSWAVVVVSLLSLLATVVFALTGRLAFEAALGAGTGIVLGGILAGAVAYSSAVNVGLGAARLESTLPDAAPSADEERPIDLDA